ncbi:MAG: hypothetical protein K0S39_5843 [Paenibacillus sp.]|jgi:hypothetical protein|nr:hypothetical protein [Paenibacillus sp.]
MLTSDAITSTLVGKRGKAGLARLLIAALLLQCMPLLHGGLSTAQATETVMEQTYSSGTSTVQSNTYTSVTPMSQLIATQSINGKITDYPWERVTPNLSPDARHAAAMAYDENAGNMVMSSHN